ncbi:unnamed protein product, partial [marine sediment metagenome]
MVFAGVLNEKKGLHCLIRAMSQVVKTIPDAILKVAGSKDGQAYTRMKSLVTELSLDNKVDFLGWVSQSQLSKLFG